MSAGIPYTPFPTLPLGVIELNTFGLFVGLGLILGGWLTIRRNVSLGLDEDQSFWMIVWLVVAGLVGARLLWVITSLDQIEDPIDVIAVWEGGLQFSGGFIAALLIAPLLTRNFTKEQRWHLLDGAALGLALGLMLGRIGCYAVGEHLGGETSFPLGITYQGGVTIDGPLEIGETYWATPVLEFIYVGLILLIMLLVDRRGSMGAGTLAGIFSIGYAISRFASDFLREYDETLYGLTGAQYMTIALLPVGAYFLRSARKRTSPAEHRALVLAGTAPGTAEEIAEAKAEGSVPGDPTGSAAPVDAEGAADAAAADAAPAGAVVTDEARPSDATGTVDEDRDVDGDSSDPGPAR